MDYLETKSGTFWALIEEGKSSILLFADKDAAINKLTDLGDPNKVQIIALSRQGKEWAIEQVSWQEIASTLIRKVKK